MPLISGILPVYNGSKTVAEAIESIIAQTFTDWELVIVDDGSKDDSFEVCSSYANRDSRIKVYRNEKNLGLARTMNRLVKLATGRFIAVQEQDDRSAPDRFALEADVLEREPEIGVVSGLAAWLDDEGKVFAHFPGILERGEQYPQDRQEMVRFLYVEQCKVVNAACMFRRELVENEDAPFDADARVSIDWQFFLHLAHRTRFWGIPSVLVSMRRGRSHKSVTKNKELQFAEARRCIRLVYDAYQHDSSSPIDRTLYRRAMAAELALEARTRGNLRGLPRLALAVAMSPRSPEVHRAVRRLGTSVLNRAGLGERAGSNRRK